MNFRNIVKSVKTGVVHFAIQKLQKLREYNVQAHIEIEDKKFTRIESEKDLEELEEHAEEIRIKTPFPDEVVAETVEFADDISWEEEAIMVASMQNNNIEDDVPDQVLRGESVDEDDELEFEDGWYPDEGNKRPHIESIKEWIKNVKWSNMNDYDLFVEYRERFGLDPQKRQKISYRQKESLLDSTAFLIARKQWYLGRKPSSMTDFDWNERTRDKRPTAGSFSKNDYMYKAYDRNYEYKSGDRDIMEEKLKEGESVRW